MIPARTNGEDGGRNDVGQSLKRESELFMKLIPANEKKDGIILPGATEFARKLGVTKDRFSKKTFLWKLGDEVYFSFVETTNEGQGYFREVVENCLSRGYTVKIPSPIGRMQQIVKKNGYKYTEEVSKIGDLVEVWVKRDDF